MKMPHRFRVMQIRPPGLFLERIQPVGFQTDQIGFVSGQQQRQIQFGIEHIRQIIQNIQCHNGQTITDQIMGQSRVQPLLYEGAGKPAEDSNLVFREFA